MIIDRKFIFTAVNPCNGKHYTQENAIVFAAKDLALVPALVRYRKACVALGCSASHLVSWDMLMQRVKIFQKMIECKVPDTDSACEIDRCIGGKGLTE